MYCPLSHIKSLESDCFTLHYSTTIVGNFSSKYLALESCDFEQILISGCEFCVAETVRRSISSLKIAGPMDLIHLQNLLSEPLLLNLVRQPDLNLLGYM